MMSVKEGTFLVDLVQCSEIQGNILASAGFWFKQRNRKDQEPFREYKL